MGTYITSDLHGDYDSFLALLNKINFNEQQDKMYILGDVLDRGKDGIKLLNYIRQRIDDGCMFMLKGNHELFAQMYLNNTLDKNTWRAWGGAPTMQELSCLSTDEQNKLKDFLETLGHFITCSFDGKEYVLTHSGIDADCMIEDASGKIDVVESIKFAVKNDEFKYLVSNDIHYIPYGKLKKFKQYVIVGHTPVIRLNANGSYQILKNEYYMDIDTGAGHREKGGKMSCVRIDDLHEYYV